jgi:hypothetical protein
VQVNQIIVHDVLIMEMLMQQCSAFKRSSLQWNKPQANLTVLNVNWTTGKPHHASTYLATGKAPGS